MTPQFRNLVFEGGGVKGIACIGAMKELDRQGYLDHISRVGGTSAGAINALIFALGYTMDEQTEILNSTDFNSFMDDSAGIFRDLWRVWRHYGWNRGDAFRRWAGKLIEQKLGSPDATFADLKRAGRPDLYMIGTNLSTGFAEVFSHERHEEMPLVEAVRISMSIPLFFTARRLGEKDEVYVDGGVVRNYPVKLFDRMKYIDMDHEPEACRQTDYYEEENRRFLAKRPGRSPYVYNRQTLGIRLDSQEEIGLFRYDEPIKGKPVKNFIGYAKALIGALMQVQENIHLHSDDWQRTLYINTLDVGTTDFDLTVEKKKQLVEQGRAGAENYFKWFHDPDESPVSRI
ncbi:MAG: patatin-like phospholipase family protein [Balneolaceae bacterium]|nr:patatin-like phospholipase family protein [Balneolaceae bacterium]